MRDLKWPLSRITYLKIRVFSQNWFCRGDICVSGLICLSCSLLVTYITACHIDSFMSNKYVTTSTFWYFLPKQNIIQGIGRTILDTAIAVQSAITQAGIRLDLVLSPWGPDSTVAVTISSWIARLQLPACQCCFINVWSLSVIWRHSTKRC